MVLAFWRHALRTIYASGPTLVFVGSVGTPKAVPTEMDANTALHPRRCEQA
jgi:hypothetical protein